MLAVPHLQDGCWRYRALANLQDCPDLREPCLPYTKQNMAVRRMYVHHARIHAMQPTVTAGRYNSVVRMSVESHVNCLLHIETVGWSIRILGCFGASAYFGARMLPVGDAGFKQVVGSKQRSKGTVHKATANTGYQFGGHTTPPVGFQCAYPSSPCSLLRLRRRVLSPAMFPSTCGIRPAIMQNVLRI